MPSKLKRMRLKLGIKQTEMARRAGIRQPSMARREKEGIKTTTTARHYAAILGCDPLELLD